MPSDSLSPPERLLIRLDADVAEVVLVDDQSVRLAPSVRGVDLAEVGNVLMVVSEGVGATSTLVVHLESLREFARALRGAITQKEKPGAVKITLRSATSSLTLDLETENDQALADALRVLAGVVDVIDTPQKERVEDAP